MQTGLKTSLLDRMMAAPERVRARLLKSTSALESSGVPYAIVGGNAVAAWVATVDEGAVRNTRDVNILINRSDLPRARAALEAEGFVHRHVASIDMFLDHPEAKAGDGVHVIFAGEKVRPLDLTPNPPVTASEEMDSLRVLTLDALVRVKLTVYRDKDRTHLRDMIGVGLLDATWPARLPAILGERLQALLDDPQG